jgi:hypothetical protein
MNVHHLITGDSIRTLIIVSIRTQFYAMSAKYKLKPSIILTIVSRHLNITRALFNSNDILPVGKLFAIVLIKYLNCQLSKLI